MDIYQISGHKYAMIAIKAMVLQIIRVYKITTNQNDIELCSDMLLRSANGYHIQLHYRPGQPSLSRMKMRSNSVKLSKKVPMESRHSVARRASKIRSDFVGPNPNSELSSMQTKIKSSNLAFSNRRPSAPLVRRTSKMTFVLLDSNQRAMKKSLSSSNFFSNFY